MYCILLSNKTNISVSSRRQPALLYICFVRQTSLSAREDGEEQEMCYEISLVYPYQ